MLSRLFGKSPQARSGASETTPASTIWTDGLRATSSRLALGLRQLLGQGKRLDSAQRDQLEELLLSADVGIDTTTYLLDQLTEHLQKATGAAEPLALFRALLIEILEHIPGEKSSESRPQVVMVVGVNGVGKTTSIGKLAHRWSREGRRLLLAAGDTFRAAATEQLQSWADRAGVPLVAQRQGADAASVIYDALQSARARNLDLVIVDTAGRLQNKAHLMEELGKVARVMQKVVADAPHEVLLVVDATTGQNALSQAREFGRIIPLTGLIITKMDGTAKGGIMLALAHQLKLPIRYLGIGEGVKDLHPFEASSVVDALLGTGDRP